MSPQVAKISVIIPVYNAEKTVAKAIESVINQDYNNIEIIIVDGRSTDNSLSLIRNYSGISCVISESDTGVYDAMNKGLKKATGDWLYFLGADDELDNVGVLSQVFRTAIPENCKLLYGNVLNEDRKDKRVPELHIGKFDNGILYKNTLHHQGSFYHKSVFYNRRYNAEYKILADYELNIHLFLEKVESKNIPILIARCQASGISKDFVKKLYREELTIKKKALFPVQYLIQLPWVWMKYLYKNV